MKKKSKRFKTIVRFKVSFVALNVVRCISTRWSRKMFIEIGNRQFTFAIHDYVESSHM